MRAVAAVLVLLPLAAAAQVPRPDVKVGDTWIYRRMDYDANRPRGIYTMRVVFAQRGVIQVVSRSGMSEEVDTTYTADWNAVTVPGRVFNPHTGWFKFPLHAGATYKASYEAILPQRGIHSRNEREVKVVGWEEIVVPAGKFRALKILSDGHYQRMDNSFASGRSRNVIWYVPEIKRWAKITLESRPVAGGGAGEHFGEELLSYDLQ